MMSSFAGATASTFIFEALLNGGHQSGLNSFGHRLAIHSFEDAQRFLGGIAHYKTIGALADMPVKFS
jgi:hypothetical protein